MHHTYNTWNEKQNNYMTINVIIAKIKNYALI
jgi:hypothetical protein